jgi:hypothetical protein
MRTIFAALLIISCSSAYAQIIPSEGDTINYLIAGFAVPKNKNAVKYVFRVAEGNYNVANADEFAKHTIVQSKPGTNKEVLELPAFGKEYTWAVSYTDKLNKIHPATAYYHFRTGYVQYIDTSLYRLRILNQASDHKDALILTDQIPVVYNMNGKPIWYLPNWHGEKVLTHGTRDLKVTKSGTFTLLDERGAYEIDYNGNVIWQAPNDGKVNGETTERYHHEFIKISSSSYMVAGHEFVQRFVADNNAGEKDINQSTEADAKGEYKKILTSTIIEYDTTGRVIWRWHEKDFDNNETLFNKLNKQKDQSEGTHMNGFYFDSKRNVIYLSFRNSNSIAKIRYPSGEIIAIYGRQEILGREHIGRINFKAQHGIMLGKNNNLYLFNNNILKGTTGVSFVAAFEEKSNNALRKVWEFSCNIDSNANSYSISGGSVVQLQDSCLLVCMGATPRIFIVNHQKEVLWNAVLQNKNEKGEWEPAPLYRASVIENRKELEPLIFHKHAN